MLRRKPLQGLLAGLLLTAAAVTAVATGGFPRGPEPADLLREGRALFFKDMRLALRMHPRAFSLPVDDIERILNAEGALPGIHDAVLRLLWLEQAEILPAPPSGGAAAVTPEFREAWLELCHDGAERFIASLFERNPAADRWGGKRSALDLVLAGLGLGSEGGARKASPTPAGMGAALRTNRFPEAFTSSLGAGVKLAVIAPAAADTAAGLLNGNGPPWTEGFPLGRPPNGNPSAAAAQAAAPEAEVTLWPVIHEPGSPYQAWSALQTALALREAVRAGARVVVVAHAYTAAHPALSEACLRAYRDHVVIVGAVGPDIGAGPESPHSWPAHERTVLAAAGAAYRSRKGAVPAEGGAVSHHNELSVAAADQGGRPEPGIAAGLCGGAAALIASRMPPREDELPGQYFQGIREILVSTADAGAMGLDLFDPSAGYGLLDAGRAAGAGADAYLAKRERVAAELKARLERMEKERREAEARRAEEKK